jgi:hypothetical protein
MKRRRPPDDQFSSPLERRSSRLDHNSLPLERRPSPLKEIPILKREAFPFGRMRNE